LANGQISFGNDLSVAKDSAEIKMINGGISGSALLSIADGGSGYWLDFATGGEPYSEFIQQITDSGVTLDALVWCQGEREIFELTLGTIITQLDYSNGLTSLIAQIRSDLGLPNLPVVIMQTGTVTQGTPTPAEQQLIRDAQSDVAAAVSGVTIRTGNTDIPLKDGFHYTDAGYITHGSRAAVAVDAVIL
jgi:hypothetical protein